VKGTASEQRFALLIGGEWVRPARTFESVDPFTGIAWACIPLAGPAEIDSAVAAARHAFDAGPWRMMNGAERAGLIRSLADLVRRDGARLAEIETRDNGKLLREMRGQVDQLPATLDYFAGWADKLHGEVLPTPQRNFLVYTLTEPVGVVGAITAWNSPLHLLVLKLAPALAAGCTVVAKPAEQASASTLAFAELVHEAGFPPGIFNVVCGDGPTVGAALVEHPGVDKVAFTGSTPAGVAVARGAAGHLARTSLELGGKSSQLVFADAALDDAVEGVVAGIFAAGGQTCLGGSRIVVQREVYDEFVERLAHRAHSIRLGDPSDPATEMGPLAFPAQHEKVLSYIRSGIEEGATLVTGGGPPGDPGLADGLFVEPTVLRDVDPGARVAQEEIFGPVACVLPFAEEDEAVALANDVDYGLAAGVWTTDIKRGHRVAAAIRAGTVWVNAYRVVAPSVPFGGFKASGYGRESGRSGLEEYLEEKSVWVEIAGGSRDPFKLG